MGEIPVIQLETAEEVSANNQKHLERRKLLGAGYRIDWDDDPLLTARQEILRLRSALYQANIVIQAQGRELVATKRLAADLHVLLAARAESPHHDVMLGRMHEILTVVATHYGFPLADILSDRRTYKITRVRQIGMWCILRITKRSQSDIGRKMGRDHSTILHGIRKIEWLRTVNPEFARELDELRVAIEMRLIPWLEESDHAAKATVANAALSQSA